MVIRIEGIPEGCKPGTYPIKYLRTNGDIAIYEYVANPRAEDEATCVII